MNDPIVSAQNLSVSFGAVAALQNVEFAVARGEILTILGPSGCGKSTLLNVIAGFIPPTAGEMRVAGTVVDGPGPDRGVVLQHHALFPWKTVSANIEFGLRMQGVPREERRERTDHFIARVGLMGFERSYPHELSGGMQQRVAIARALATEPAILLMDEPFGSLDAHTRLVMRDLLVSLWEEQRQTIFFVTHDVDEALALGDRVLFFTARPGRVERMVPVDLPRPRTDEILASAPFGRVKALALKIIREQASTASTLAGPKSDRTAAEFSEIRKR